MRGARQSSSEIAMKAASARVLSIGAVLLGAWCLVPAQSHAQSYSFLDSIFPPGARLSNHDLKAMAKSAQPLLEDETLPIGTTRDWSNPESGDHGTVQLLRRFEYSYEGNKLPCREILYHTQVKVSADPYNYKLSRCKVADGSWKTL
jgi:surface antigen